MGWDGKGNREKPIGWDRDRRKTWKRAGGRCEDCGTKTVLDGPGSGRCDHIIPWWRGGIDHRVNYRWLCAPCHGMKTRLEERERRDMGKPTHPGLRDAKQR